MRRKHSSDGQDDEFGTDGNMFRMIPGLGFIE